MENGFAKGFSSFGLHASVVKNKKSIKNWILTIFIIRVGTENVPQ
ncbi:hypothetical protein LEP1GSC086_1801 [Leptospira weilii str. LNT 1234]|nr:hypothetical protein LEP1GSC086_1801 [Leptospira weilii str. LNT 1234]